MTEHYITQLQVKAWQEENTALRIKAEGFPAFAYYHEELAASYRSEDAHNKIVDLFERLDKQNAIIDVGLKIKSQDKPIRLPQFATSVFNRDLGDERSE